MLRTFIIILSFSALSTATPPVMYDFDCPAAELKLKNVNEFCMKGAVDDAIMVASGALLFKGDKVALQTGFDTRTFAKGYPMMIDEAFPSLPGHIDAAFTYTPTGKIYIMKGSMYWRYSGNGSDNSLDDGFPRPIFEGFKGVPDNVDAAVEWGNFIYFFKDDIYYKFQPCKNLSYVGPINELPGVPDGIEGVVRHPNGHVYFFKGDLYYDFELSSNKVVTQPHVVSWEWFRCYERKP